MSKAPLTAAAILAIPLAAPERLFSGDPAALRAEWHALIARFHPDRHPDEAQATQLLQHINALHAEALHKLAAGAWEIPGLLRLDAVDGRRFELKFRRKGVFELGEHYIGAAFVAYSIAKSDRDLFDRAFSTIRRLSFRDAAMQV